MKMEDNRKFTVTLCMTLEQLENLCCSNCEVKLVRRDNDRNQGGELFTLAVDTEHGSISLHRNPVNLEDVRESSGDKSSKPELFECPRCHKSFRSKEYLRLHETSQHPEEDSQEIRTSEISSPPPVLEGDSASGSPVVSRQLWECDTCQKSFRCRKYLRKHVASDHQRGTPVEPESTEVSSSSVVQRTPLWECGTCNRSFKERKYLDRHVQKSHPRRKRGRNPGTRQGLKCTRCRRVFTFRKSFQIHKEKCWVIRNKYQSLRSRPPKKPGLFKCSQCPNVYKSRQPFSRHLKTHRLQGSRKWQVCTICGFWCISRSSLDSHRISAHTKKFQCDICAKTFHGQRQLDIHRRIHFKKVFSCRNCGKEYKFKSCWRTHENGCEEGIEEIPVPEDLIGVKPEKGTGKGGRGGI